MGNDRAPLIVLLYPRVEPDMPHGTKLLGVPLPVLTLARPLLDAGYEVQILDENAAADAGYKEVLDSYRAYQALLDPWYELAEKAMLDFSAG